MDDSFRFRRNPFQPQMLTPGPLGYNDSASPDTPGEFVGETPGPLGMNDYADPNVKEGNWKPKRPRTMRFKWDRDAAAAYLKDQKNGWATFKSQGKCARAVRLAINAGHMATPRNPLSAADYKEYLPTLGFVTVMTEGYAPQIGDIADWRRALGNIFRSEGSTFPDYASGSRRQGMICRAGERAPELPVCMFV